VTFWDFLPTLAELGGAEVPEDLSLDGISVAASFLHGTTVGNERPLYWEFRLKPDTSLMQAVRWGRWKAVRLSEGADLEIYDLEEDIGETQDVAAQHPELVEKFEAFLSTARD
jgi:arylsulfatase A-like enzyme